MPANPVELQPLRVLARVQFQACYLRNVGMTLLRDVPAADRVKDTAGFLRAIERVGQAPLAARVEEQANRTAAGWQLEATRFILAALDAQGPPESPCSERRPEFFDWVLRNHPAAEARGAALGEMSLLGALYCHRLLLHAQAASGPRGPEAGVSMRPQLDAELARLRRASLTTGDQVSHMAALLAFRFVREPAGVAGRFDPAASWAPMLESLDPETRTRLLGLAALNGLAMTAVSELRQAVEAEGLRHDPPPLRLADRVHKMLGRLQDFSRRLMMGKEPVRPEPPLQIGTAAEAETRAFGSIHSPLVSERESRAFHEAIRGQLAACEKKLFFATVMPRPGLHDGFLRLARRRFLMAQGIHFPLSEFCLHSMLFCHSLLALSAATTAAEREAAEKPRELAIGLMKNDDLTVGDMFAVFLALEGLRRAMSDVVSHRGVAAGGEGGLAWPALFGHLDPRIQELVLLLAAKSPMVRLAMLDLEALLHRAKTPWAGLDRFLEDPAGDLLRDYVAGILVAEVRRNPGAATPVVLRAVRECLQTVTVGGAQLAAEFFQMFLKGLFGPCELLAGTENVRPGEGDRPDRALKREKTLQRFERWFCDLDQPLPALVLPPLVELMHRIRQLENDPAHRGDPRLALLGQRWRSISLLTTRGLRDRLWYGAGRRLLEIFWLNYCLLAAELQGGLDRGLDTGDPEWDDLGRLAARITARLWRAWRALERQRKAQSEAGGGVQAVPEEDQRLFGIIQRQIAQATKRKPFRMVLQVKRMIIRDASGNWVCNERRLEELQVPDRDQQGRSAGKR